MDGNNSLKRLAQKERKEQDGPKQPVIESSKERVDTRTVSGDYYLTREEVNKWSKDSFRDIFKESLDSGENPCVERWKNLNKEVTAKMWGIHEGTGVFLCLCWHSFVLLIADMVQSGELSKYPLAILDCLLDVICDDIGMGYDIGCGFKTTIERSPLGPKARAKRLVSLVGAFHGHGHGRLCQTSHLATYVKGLGLEHLEGCETFFSESNKLASAVRHMNMFHRRQAIARYCYHHDNFEAYTRLSKFLVDNYKQAIELQATRPALAQTMSDLGVSSTDEFHQWLNDEHEYLKGLKKEPQEETLQMEYYKKLVKLNNAELKVKATTRNWTMYTPEDVTSAF